MQLDNMILLLFLRNFYFFKVYKKVSKSTITQFKVLEVSVNEYNFK